MIKEINKNFINVLLENSTSFEYIKNWKIDKFSINKNNRITKIEVYNYFYIKDLKKMIEYLNSSKFKYFTNPKDYPRIYNIILNQEGKHIISRGKIINLKTNKYKYYYFVHFARVLNHRKRPILIKLYWNKSQNKDFFKLELTYSYFKKNYNQKLLDSFSSIKTINEIIKKIENVFSPIGFKEDFSGKILLTDFIYKRIYGEYIKIRKKILNNILKIVNPNKKEFNFLVNESENLKEFNRLTDIENKYFLKDLEEGKYNYLINYPEILPIINEKENKELEKSYNDLDFIIQFSHI